MNIALNMRHAFRQQHLSNTALLCLPRLQVLSTGHKCVAPLLELPIKNLGESIAVEKLPWTLTFSKAAMITLHTDADVTHCRYVMCPSNLSATLAITSTFNPPASQNVASLAVVLHCDANDVTVKLRSCQVELLVGVTSQLQVALNKLSESHETLQSFSQKPSVQPKSETQTFRPTAAQQRSLDQPGSSSAMDTSFDHSPPGIEPVPTETLETDSFVSRGKTPSDASDGSSSHVSMSLWMQCTLPRMLVLLSATDAQVGGKT